MKCYKTLMTAAAEKTAGLNVMVRQDEMVSFFMTQERSSSVGRDLSVDWNRSYGKELRLGVLD
jgi:hypothetical protein